MTAPSTVIIIGGSLAAFTCARVLGAHCQRVIVVDRDDAPGDDGARPGVPQARHAHVILDRGRRELEHCVPGFGREITARGARLLDPGLELATLGNTTWMPRVATDSRMLCASRDLTDATARALVSGLAHVELRTRSEVSALRLAGRTVQAVEIQRRGGGAPEIVPAALVVDASGRSSKLPALLAQAGVKPPDETVIDSGTWYSTRWFHTRPRAEAWWQAVLIAPTLTAPGALLTPVEGDRCIVSIAHVGLGQPEISEDNFLATLQGLRSPIIAESVGEPLSSVFGYRATVNRLRHYAAWADPVAGLVAVGDAACVLNPIHGQGVTCTAVCARLLADTIAAHGLTDPALATTFHKAQARWLREPWGLATGFDLRYPTTVGKRSLAPKLLGPYMKLFAEAFHGDPRLLRLLVGDVGQLNRPFSMFMTPRMVAQVLGSAAQRRLRRQPSPVLPATPYPPHTIRA
jgi:flavin-dependent dehydrogenase